MTKSALRKTAKRTISDGKTKQETFDELSLVSSIPLADLSLIIRRISSIPARNKYRILNYVLVIFLSLTVAVKMLESIPTIVEKGLFWIPIIMIYPAINILLLVGVASYNYLAYLWVAILSILGLLGVFLKFAQYPSLTLFIVDVAFMIIFIFLAFFLKAKLFPYYVTKKEMYQNELGENRMRYVFRFVD